jgi:hypothetical protein
MLNTLINHRMKSEELRRRIDDPELAEHLDMLDGSLEAADAMRAQLEQLLRQVRSTVAYPVRPQHLREAMTEAERTLARVAP